MKNLISAVLVLSVFSLSVISCEKEKETLLQATTKQTPTFSSQEELNTSLKALEAMSEEERRAYEAEHGYISLHTESYQRYEQIDPATLSDLEPLYQHVAKHADVLEIAKDEQGELEYRPIYADNSYSLIAGSDRMIVVGESCLKVFEDGIVTAPLEALDALSASQGTSIHDVPNNKDYTVAAFDNRAIVQKSNCGTSKSDTETNGNNRTKLSVSCSVKLAGGVVPYLEARGSIIPQKRSLGIWFRARRTITGRFKFTLAYEEPGTNNTIEVPITQNIGPNLAYSEQRTYAIPTGALFPLNYRFSAIDSFGDTPSTGPATIVCH